MKSVLIVDDDIDLLSIMSSVMEKQQLNTYTATGIHTALKLLEDKTVDIICSDFNMRDGTGLELLETLRQQNVKTPFVLMSGNYDLILKQEAERLSASFFYKADHDLIEKIKSFAESK